MTSSRKLVLVAPLVALGGLLASSGAARADRVIDAFSDPLPLTTLPGTSTPAPLMWAGRSGSSTQLEQTSSQSNLAGVLGGHRYTRVREATLSNLVVASSTQASGRPALTYATGTGPSGLMSLEYGSLSALNANLLVDGSQAFELSITGDMDDGATPRPVQLTIAVRSGTSALVSRSFALLSDGVYQFPFSLFSGVSFSDLDYVRFTFDATLVAAVDYTLIGGLRTTNCVQSGGALADRFVDTFEANLPLRTIPGSGTYPIMWAGTINGVSKAVDTAAQSGLAGVLGGGRDTRVAASAIQNFLAASMTSVGATPALTYATGYPTSGSLTLEYGARGALNANLSALRAFELELDGDLASGAPRPLALTVTVTSGAVTATAQLSLLGNGRYYLPFTAFSGINFADVDRLKFFFDASAVSAVDFTLIGGLRATACVN